MTTENHNDPRKQPAPHLMPWVLGVLMLVIYLITLNHWVTLANLLPVAKISGFGWQPENYNPVLYLITLPFRLLPVATIPLGLNLFSAVCAAITLMLLARSVAILPHDRTQAQRLREKSDFAFLTIKSAWFPPLLAVLMLGLQFGFWENATSFTGDMPSLLMFACVIWLLLEYRLDERAGRLTLAALIYGAGMAENWAMIGFFPIFIAALIWLRRGEFFRISFLSRMLLAGLAGLSLLFLLPLVGRMTDDIPLNFWQRLKPALQLDWSVIHQISDSGVRHNLMLMAITTFMPILVMAIRWSATFGDSSRTGTILTNYMFYLIHAVVFTTCVWVMFDPPFSPGQLAMGSPALTFYYLSAIGVGYYCGYFLLVFGKATVVSKRFPRPVTALPGALNILSPVIYGLTYIAAGLAVAMLIFINLPQIRSLNDNTLLRYAQSVEQSLPPGKAILLSDSEGGSTFQQARTLLMQVALARSRRSKDYLVVDTQSLNWAPYHRYLHRKAPQFWPDLIKDKSAVSINPIGILSALNLLSKSNNICYLNPSIGYYFEVFYNEPNGLLYNLKPIPEDTLLPPALAPSLMAANQKFWSQIEADEFPRIEKSLVANEIHPRSKLVNWLLVHLHAQRDPNPNALLAANLYSRALNFWGVELQRANDLKPAAACFAAAGKINPDNIIANINLEFNKLLQTGHTAAIDLNKVSPEQFGKYRDWNSVLLANGPFDEPSFLFADGALLAQGGYMRQALAQFARVRELAPDNLPARLWVAQLYLFNHLPGPAMEALHEPLISPNQFGLNQTNSTELNVLASAGYLQKGDIADGVKLLQTEISRHPEDRTLATTAAQAYFMRGLYTNALDLVEHELEKQPNDPQWLFGKGYACLQMGNYPQAISTLTKVLEISTNDASARFNRALAYLQTGKLDEARADYALLQADHTNSFQIAYGLAEVAWRQHNTNEAVHNYELYLANAPTNSAEAKLVHERLTQLKPK